MLDDDNSARYTDAADLVPAMNSAIGYITTLFTAAFEQKITQPEILSELTEVILYLREYEGTLARINLNDSVDGTIVFNDIVWRIIGVDPYAPAASDEMFYMSSRLAKRMTIEEFGYSTEDPFAPGYEDVPDDFSRACYMGPNNVYGDDNPHISIRPGAVPDKYSGIVNAGVWVLMKHPEITSGTSVLKFPVNTHPIIEQKMLQYITYQSDDERLFKITDKEVKELIQLMN